MDAVFAPPRCTGVQRDPGDGAVRRIPALVLALFAAVGLGSLLADVRQFWICAGIVAAVIIVIGAESMVAVAFTEPPHDRASRAVNRALPGDPGPVLELPVGSPDDGWPWAYIETPRQYLAWIDGDPRISGYSGFAPPGFEETAATLSRSRATRPSTASMTSGSATWCSAPASRTDSPPPRPKGSVSTASVCTAMRTPAAIVDASPPDRVACVDQYGDAWLIELR